MTCGSITWSRMSLSLVMTHVLPWSCVCKDEKVPSAEWMVSASISLKSGWRRSIVTDGVDGAGSIVTDGVDGASLTEWMVPAFILTAL